MNPSTLWLGIGAAVLLFWSVGAFNRLVALRGAIVRGFAPVDEQFRLRHALLLRQAEALAHTDPTQAQALLAACAQALAACDHARAHPGAAGAITSLRLAEEVLAETRQRIPSPPSGAEAAALTAEVAASDTTLAFACRQFNERVSRYNSAVRQFPTWLLAGLFRFRPAGTL
jgi:LemA protein